jgi:hypothetical protein
MRRYYQADVVKVNNEERFEEEVITRGNPDGYSQKLGTYIFKPAIGGYKEIITGRKFGYYKRKSIPGILDSEYIEVLSMKKVNGLPLMIDKDNAIRIKKATLDYTLKKYRELSKKELDEVFDRYEKECKEEIRERKILALTISRAAIGPFGPRK